MTLKRERNRECKRDKYGDTYKQFLINRKY